MGEKPNSVPMPSCPECPSKHTVKNGRIHTGKQRFLCKSGGRQFVQNPTNKIIDSKTRELVDRLLLERLSLAGIARAVQVSEQWLQDYVNHKAQPTTTKAEVRPKKSGCDPAGTTSGWNAHQARTDESARR